MVRVINLCKGPIRLQFRRLTIARCVKHMLDSQLTGLLPSCTEMNEKEQAELGVSVSVRFKVSREILFRFL